MRRDNGKRVLTTRHEERANGTLDRISDRTGVPGLTAFSTLPDNL